MIVIDSSAFVAILRVEPEAAEFTRIIGQVGVCLVSAVSLLETSMVMAGRTGTTEDWTELDELIADAAIDIVPHDRRLAAAAREAFLRYGKGRHPAALNMGDWATYAHAQTRMVPLLFKGDDFSRTDVEPAWRGDLQRPYTNQR